MLVITVNSCVVTGLYYWYTGENPTVIVLDEDSCGMGDDGVSVHSIEDLGELSQLADDQVDMLRNSIVVAKVFPGLVKMIEGLKAQNL